MGLGNLWNEGIRYYIQVLYDFIQDSIRKLVLTGPPALFSLFLLPHLMDTPHIWYLWKGIFKAHLGVAVSWCADHFSWNTLAFTGTWPLTHIVNIPVFYPRLSLSGPLILPCINSYSSYSSVLGVLGVILRQNSKVD